MIVVADSGPLNYLILLEQIELLRRLLPNEVCAKASWMAFFRCFAIGQGKTNPYRHPC